MKTATTSSSSIRSVRRGKHHIIIGMAPGVGKTFLMLEQAHKLKLEGIDVVIGVLETHGRKETAKKAQGLEIVLGQKIVRGGLTLTEMDTDGILARSPQVVLVDELAHTNVPGCSRQKRYQDVEVLLAAGINVYSTFNIQHLESLNDLVARITSVVVRERIPDRLLEEADEVVVVDVTPQTLEERLLEGKIYAPDKIQQSLSNFFQRRHLMALRELALRVVADKVESHKIASQPAAQLCNVHERVLVCVSTFPQSMQLLRRGARLADYMKAALYAVFVAAPDRLLTKEESLYIETCEQLCLEFGGTFIRLTDQNIPKAIAQVAKDYHVTQVFVGKSQRSLCQVLLRGSLTQQLERLLDDVDLHIIATEKKPQKDLVKR